MFRSKLSLLILRPLKTNTVNNPPLEHAEDFGEPTIHANFLRAWKWWLPQSLLGLALVLYFVDPFIGDWDGLDYTMLSLAGYPSSMALGRNLFIFSNHSLYVFAHALFGLQPEQAYLLFKYAVVAQAPLAVMACWMVAYSVSDSLHTAALSALLIICSPVFVLYGGQVMTDVPSVLVLGLALVVHLRGIRKKNLWLILIGAGLLGMGVNLRETVGFFAPWLILAPISCGWKIRKHEILYVAGSIFVFLIFAFGWFGYWFITDPYYRHVWYGWRESMRQESSRHPVSLTNLGPFVTYLFITAPFVFLTLPFAPVVEWWRRHFSPMLALWFVALFADFLLFFNYSTTVNWRYFLTGLPGLAPLASSWLLLVGTRFFGNRNRALLACVLIIVGFATTFTILMRPVSFEFITRRAMSKEYVKRLKQLPPDAVMISGAQTIAVTYWTAIGAGSWETIGTGGGWPGDRLFSVIDDHLMKGKRVFIDSDPRWWLPCGWQSDEIPMITRLEEHYRFRHMTGDIYELRPKSDETAHDEPNLKRLLPENRPEDTRRCPPNKL